MDMRHIGRKAALSAAVTLALTAQSDVFAQDQGLEEIVVTGSRIARRDFSAQSPIVTVDAESFNSRSNVGLEATLNQLPQFTVAGTQASTSPASTPFPQASAAPGAATINLRGLGLNRSLVLLDGRRVQPVNGQLVVDLNTIPSAAIERVEVITGGAAAVYGADAIAGVVNFILKRDFQGVQFSGQTGITEEGDGEETSFNGLLGATFADGRGNVMLGADYSDREIILGKDREWVVEGWDDPGTNPGGLGSSNLTQMTVAAGNAPTLFPLSPQAGGAYTIDQNGNVFDHARPFDANRPYTGPIGPGTPFKINPTDGTLGFDDKEHRYLQLPLERYSIFGSGQIELTDNVDIFSDIRFSETFASSQGFTSQLFNVWSPVVPYNPAVDDPDSPTFGTGGSRHPVPRAFADLLNSRPTPNANWTYVGGLDYLPNFRTETTSNVYQVIGGIEGEATVGSKAWDWTVYASHGKTSVNAHQPEGFPFLPRVQNLFNHDQYGEGFDVLSLPGAVPLAVTGHCTSGLPIFNPDGSVDNTPAVSQDCADWVVLRMNSITSLTQDVIEASATGGLADMWAGELRFAMGVGTREENFRFDPDSGYNANQRFPDVVQNIILPVSVNGSTDVKEFFAELAIPLVQDRKLVQSFELNPGYRYSDYNTVGGIDTYKMTADWVVNDRVRVRGGHQFANRAPNVTELFTPLGGSQLGGGNDACGYFPVQTTAWGNRPENPNRLNLQQLCQHLMVRDGAPPSLYEPGQASANTYNYNVFGGQGFFPFTIGVTEGNAQLDSESAHTTTAGVVFTLFDRTTISVDWFEIKLKNAIGIPTADVVYQQCLDAQYNPLIGTAPLSLTGAQLAAGNPFCSLIQREYVGGAPLTPGNYGAARRYSAQYINQGGIVSEGIDVQADFGVGNFSVNLLASFLENYSESPFPGAAFIDYTGTTFNSSFDYRLFSTVRYNNGPFSIGVRWQYMPELDVAPGAAPNAFGIEDYDRLDLFGSWQFGERLSMRGGIDNVTNEDPAIVGRTTLNNAKGSTNSNYDQFGRRVFLGLTVAF
jgi:outer membrane receptor protein involved in Fe transport